MKSLSLKSLSSKKSPFNFTDCFDAKATVGSILYSRCLLYIVLFISLINLFYIINLRNTYSLVIFFLVGFVTSFFIKNMIIIILFATFVSLFFQTSQYQYANEGFIEGFKEKNSKKESMSEGEQEEEEGEKKKTDKDDKESMTEKTKKPEREGYKYTFQGEEGESKSDDNDDSDLGNESGLPPVTKTAKLKKDMEQYFEIQKELLTVLEKAEPLQKKAEAFKEKFNTRNSK